GAPGVIPQETVVEDQDVGARAGRPGNIRVAVHVASGGRVIVVDGGHAAGNGGVQVAGGASLRLQVVGGVVGATQAGRAVLFPGCQRRADGIDGVGVPRAAGARVIIRDLVDRLAGARETAAVGKYFCYEQDDGVLADDVRVGAAGTGDGTAALRERKRDRIGPVAGHRRAVRQGGVHRLVVDDTPAVGERPRAAVGGRVVGHAGHGVDGGDVGSRRRGERRHQA